MVWSYAVGGWRSASLEVGGRGQERNDAGTRGDGDAARKAKDRGQRVDWRLWISQARNARKARKDNKAVEGECRS
jgi:hypothetical protein